MARALRVQYPGAVYHVTLRGNARQNIFEDALDYERFQRRLAEAVDLYGVRLHAYCLMTNHAHLVLETPEANLSRFMQSLSGGYATYFNLRHQRVGHLSQGRFGAQLVEADEYLHRLSRYVHLNPVCTKAAKQLPRQQRVDRLRRYRWSSYRSYVGLDKPLAFVRYGPVLAMMPGSGRERAAEYRRFVESGLARTDREFQQLRGVCPRSIGGEPFRQWVDGLYQELLGGRKQKEDVAWRRPVKRVSAEVILEQVGKEFGLSREALGCRSRDSTVRSAAARMLVQQGGLTQREAGAQLGLGTGAAVSIQLRRLAERLSGDQKLRHHLDRIAAALAR